MGKKWDRSIIVKLCPDEDVHNASKLLMNYHRVGSEFRFTSEKEANWSRFEDGCFKKLPNGPPTLSDKLMVVGHGSHDQVGLLAHGDKSGVGWTANQFAMKLWECGLKEIGLITFKCCDVGKANFLKDLSTEFGNFKMKVGWLKGYTDAVHIIERDSDDVKEAGGKKGDVYAAVERPKTFFEGLSPFLSSDDYFVNYKDDRVKLVKGNTHVTITPARYKEHHGCFTD